MAELNLVMAWILALMPGLAAAAFVASFITTIVEMLVFTALGLWMRQYNVPLWGGPDDPLPILGPVYNTGSYAAPGQGQVPYGYGYTDYGQAAHGNVGDTYGTGNRGY